MGFVNFGTHWKFVNWAPPSAYFPKRGTAPQGEGLDFTDWCEVGDSVRGWIAIAAWEEDLDLAESVRWLFAYIDAQQRWHMSGRMHERQEDNRPKTLFEQ